MIRTTTRRTQLTVLLLATPDLIEDLRPGMRRTLAIVAFVVAIGVQLDAQSVDHVPTLPTFPQSAPASDWVLHFDPDLNGFASQVVGVDALLLPWRPGAFPLRYSGNAGPCAAPSFGESLVPILGATRAACNDFAEGRLFWGSLNAAVAFSDIAIATAVVKGVSRGAVKLGRTYTWGVVGPWYRHTRSVADGVDAHHWLIPRGGGGRLVPDWIKSQPWNLVPVPAALHRRGIHGRQSGLLNVSELVYGTPTWFTASPMFLVGHSLQGPRAREGELPRWPDIVNLPDLPPGESPGAPLVVN